MRGLCEYCLLSGSILLNKKFKHVGNSYNVILRLTERDFFYYNQ